MKIIIIGALGGLACYWLGFATAAIFAAIDNHEDEP